MPYSETMQRLINDPRCRQFQPRIATATAKRAVRRPRLAGSSMSAKCSSCNVKWAFANGLCRGCKDAAPPVAVGVPVGEKENSGRSSVSSVSTGMEKMGIGASAPPPRAPPKFKPVGPPKETCTACSGTVYAAERAVVRSRIFHVTCLKCSDCGKKLTPGTVELDAESRIFCKIHFQQRRMSGQLDVAAGGSAALEVAGASNVAASELGERYAQTKENAQTSSAAGAFGDQQSQQGAKAMACNKCGQTVYDAEKMLVEWSRKGKPHKQVCHTALGLGLGPHAPPARARPRASAPSSSRHEQVYHKACFRCLDCNALLRAGQYEMCPTCDEPPRADLVCKAHFAERLMQGKVLGTPQYTGGEK